MSRSFWDRYAALDSDIDATRALLVENGRGMPGPLAGPVQELLAGGGKLLRPGFVILAGRFGRYDQQKMCRLAAAVEMFHLATLVHDDIIDAADLRRGRPSIPRRLGARDAVLVGDWLLARSFLTMAGSASSASAEAFARSASRLCSGEVREVASERSLAVDAAEYFRRVEGKTAALFSASFRLGATESGCAPELREQLSRIGHDLGMAFQIIDDILDVEGEENRLGKPTGQDLGHGIYTLPIIYALASSARAELEALLSGGAAVAGRQVACEPTERILEILRESRSLERARLAARRYSERALRLVDGLPRRGERTILADAVSRLTERAA